MILRKDVVREVCLGCLASVKCSYGDIHLEIRVGRQEKREGTYEELVLQVMGWEGSRKRKHCGTGRAQPQG